MRTEDYSKAFPKKVNVETYMPVIKAALDAGTGVDGMPKVVLEDYDNHQLATRAANAIRNHSRAQKLNLKVSLPDGVDTISVYKGKAQKRKEKKESAAEPALAGAKA